MRDYGWYPVPGVIVTLLVILILLKVLGVI